MSEPIPKGELWWCNSHSRKATAINEKGEHVCGPEYRGGITLPCMAVELTGIAEIKEEDLD